MLLSSESRSKPQPCAGGIKFVLVPCLKVHALCGFHLRVGISKARFPSAWYSGRIKIARLPGDVFAPTWQGHPSILISPDTERTAHARSEEHTSELQSLRHLVCRLLLEKKKNW